MIIKKIKHKILLWERNLVRLNTRLAYFLKTLNEEDYIEIDLGNQLDYFIVRIKNRVRAGELYLSRKTGNLSYGN